MILSTPPPTLRPEIHTVFPTIVTKARRYSMRVKQILEWHNRIEATMIVEVECTTDDECILACLAAAAKKTSAATVSSPPSDHEQKAEQVASLDVMESIGKSSSSSLRMVTAPQPSSLFPLFAIDFVSRRNIWEGKVCCFFCCMNVCMCVMLRFSGHYRGVCLRHCFFHHSKSTRITSHRAETYRISRMVQRHTFYA